MTEKKWVEIDISDAKPLDWDNYESEEHISFSQLIPEYERLKGLYPDLDVFLECKARGYEKAYAEITFAARRLETDEELARRIANDKARNDQCEARREQQERETLAQLLRKYVN